MICFCSTLKQLLRQQNTKRNHRTTTAYHQISKCRHIISSIKMSALKPNLKSIFVTLRPLQLISPQTQ